MSPSVIRTHNASPTLSAAALVLFVGVRTASLGTDDTRLVPTIAEDEESMPIAPAPILSPEQERTVASIEVLGGDGLIVADNVVWEDDGFVYRLTADEIRDTSTGRPVDSVINRLELVDRTEWDAAIERAQRGSVWGRVLRLRQSLRWPHGS